jgi:hypothetical protein
MGVKKPRGFFQRNEYMPARCITLSAIAKQRRQPKMRVSGVRRVELQ